MCYCVEMTESLCIRFFFAKTRLPVTDTIIHHELESNGAMPVDGYQEAGSYGKKIRYNVDKEQGEKQIYTLIDRAKNCYQNVRYRCRWACGCGWVSHVKGRCCDASLISS